MSVNNSRIAKNTVYLYIRMIFVLGANFFAVRVLLEALGVEDCGLFNLIVGFVTLFTLLNGAMQSTVQRFNYNLAGLVKLRSQDMVYVRLVVGDSMLCEVLK